MRWTDWRMLARGSEWFDGDFDHDGPACYELGTCGPRGGDPQPHYVGETSNERRRMFAYAQHGSHLSSIISTHLRDGWTLCYRAVALDTKGSAKQMQDRLLRRHKYDWN